MVNATEVIKEIFYGEKYDNLSSLLDGITYLLKVNTHHTDEITSDLADSEFLNEVRTLTRQGIPIYFGKTLRSLKCVIVDDKSREHIIYLFYNGPKKLIITSTQLPHSPLQDQEYSSIVEVVTSFKNHVESLKGYFHELEGIDRYCTVVDPQNPTFKEDYRRILLDDRTWLHVEVTPEGLATNVHLVGHSEQWQEKLQAGLLQWDHDVDIVENITAIFDMVHFPNIPSQDNRSPTSIPAKEKPQELIKCCICLCRELPELPGLPQPLCQNPLCGMYFHRDCLFQWLVACAGGRPPAFGVANGNCPCCLQSVTCNIDG